MVFACKRLLYYALQRRRIGALPDESSGAFVGKGLIVFYCGRNTPLQSLGFARSHRPPKLLAFDAIGEGMILVEKP